MNALAVIEPRPRVGARTQVEHLLNMDPEPALVEPAGAYAVVRVWCPPWHHEAGPAEPVEYVKMPSPSLFDESVVHYWYSPDSSDGGWSWEQIIRGAVRVELVREGMRS